MKGDLLSVGMLSTFNGFVFAVGFILVAVLARENPLRTKDNFWLYDTGFMHWAVLAVGVDKGDRIWLE